MKGSQNGPIFKGWLIGQWDQGHRVVLHDQGGGNHLPIFHRSGSKQVPYRVTFVCIKFKFPIVINVFNKHTIIVNVIKGLSVSTASLVLNLF